MDIVLIANVMVILISQVVHRAIWCQDIVSTVLTTPTDLIAAYVMMVTMAM